MRITMNTLILIISISIVFASPIASAAHYIAGYVNDAFDGTVANGYQVVLWNPANGIASNLTDIIGQGGNSGVDNIYFIDCELLGTPCNIGDEIRVRVLDNGSSYLTDYVNISITGAGFDVMPDLRLNSPPNVSLISPQKGANISSAQINFSCGLYDADGGLTNVTLYGNWSGWHANETKNALGTNDNINFSKVLTEGRYSWNCLAKDNLSISKFAYENFSFNLDLTPPEIGLIGLNLSENLCGQDNYVRVNCTSRDNMTGVKEVIIESISASGRINHTANLISGDTYFADILLNETGTWMFNCIARDSADNYNNKTSIVQIQMRSNEADLEVLNKEILFDDNLPLENQIVKINATIYNGGCSESNNFLTGFFEENPSSGRMQIGTNISISILPLKNITIGVDWGAKIGRTNISIYVDLNNLIVESNESNNLANRTINVTAWQDFYGNLTINKVLSSSDAKNMSFWTDELSLEGNVFIVDKDHDVDWGALQAIGKNASGETTTDDFSDIDTMLNMEELSDSVGNVFTVDGNTPKSFSDFLIRQNIVYNVPVVNSTDTSNFLTGILWDKSDDTNGQYDLFDKEDLIFITKVDKNSTGYYGQCDYELRIPARLREYRGPDTNEVLIYFDLN